MVNKSYSNNFLKLFLKSIKQKYVLAFRFNFSFRDYKFSLMSGKLNKEEQIQVVIRIKPTLQQIHSTKSVYLSQQQQSTLVVQTPNKKEYFVFDSIADETCTQSELYDLIGKDALTSSTEGYNCCIFAYGQTGAGKTHSILGVTQEIATNIYCESRGILPRLLGDIFSWCQAETDHWSIKCSYMQIYNEQIFDLLNTDEKLRLIREDIKKGVYVQGLSKENAFNYEEAMTTLLKGVKNRKVFATSMNNQSSRSHTIFTLNLQTQIKEADTIKTRKSKINIVDLAGSERAKQTKVQGDRLKQGCNINKSLHVLGNVINALVESSKKKKHIPFRDSKLTYYLKDSLCGNSITKLLANIHPSKTYLGDTLSTLMFAKRAKILKMKVQVNENVGQNFQQLRKQIRKLRQQLKEARYIKNQVKLERNKTERSSDQQFYQSYQRIIDTSGFDYSKNENALQVFEENQLNYKALMEIYEQHMKVCQHSNNSKKKMNNMHHQWKVLQKKNETYKNLLKNMPAFTKIFKQNILMKDELDKKKQKHQLKDNQTANRIVVTQNLIKQQTNRRQQAKISRQILTNIKDQYQKMLLQIQEKFTNYINTLQTQYRQLQHQNTLKDARIKDLCKRKELPPEMQELLNQNQYLKLNVMELQNDITKLSDLQTKYQIEIKQLRKELNTQQQQASSHKKNQQITEFQQDENLPEQISEKLHEIQTTLDQQIKIVEQQRQQAYNYIEKLKQFALKINEENKNQSQTIQILKSQNKNLRSKMNSLLKIDNEAEIKINSNNLELNTFWTNQQSNFSEEFQLFNKNQPKENLQLVQKMLQRQQASRTKIEEELEKEKNKIFSLSEEIVKLHHSYGIEISKLKDEIAIIERDNRMLSDENSQLNRQLKKIYYQTQEQLIQNQSKSRKSSRQFNQFKKQDKKMLNHAKSYKNLGKMKEQTDLGVQDITKKKKSQGNYSTSRKSTLKIREQDPSAKYTSAGNKNK